MTAQKNLNPVPVLLMAVLAILMVAIPSVHAQQEPTPVPETPAVEPAATPEEPEAASEPAATAEPEKAAEPAAPAAPAVPAEKAVPTVYREKTLVTVNGRAEMNGTIELVVQPNNEEPTKVRTNIVAKTKTKKITKELTNQLIFALGDRYKVKQTGDKTIRITAKKKMPPVAISLMTQNLAGVSVMIGQG